MKSLRSRRLLAVVGVVMISGLAMLALTLAMSRHALARPDESKQGQPALSPTATLSLPLVKPVPPIATPKPGASQPGVPQSHSAAVQAVRFRPEVRLQRGAAPPKPQAGAVKTAQPSGPAKPIEPPQPGAAYRPPDVNGVLSAQGWSILAYEGFEGIFPTGNWQLYDFSDDGYERYWDDTNYGYWVGSWSAWPAAGGTDALYPVSGTLWYTDNLDTWMEYGPVDLSSMYDAYVSFGLYYDTEPDYDPVYFCVSVDQVNYSCNQWSGYSSWTDQAFWLTSYAGYSQVWFAWVFYSDSSVSTGYYGPYVDEIYIWGDDTPPTPPQESCNLDGQLVLNCGFENGDAGNWSIFSGPYQAATSNLSLRPEIDKHSTLPGAQPKIAQPGPGQVESISSVVITNIAPAEGTYHALMSWSGAPARDSLYQQFNIPNGVTNVAVNYWYAVTTYETSAGYDFFCASLQTPGGSFLVDFGCMDAVDTDNYWHEFVYNLSGAELNAVRGQTVKIVFDLYNDDSLGTYGWVDFTRVYATGGSGGASNDPNEPNNDPGTATTLACSQTITTGVIGDALGGSDVDWFKLQNVPAGRLDIDIDARTQVPPSDLDSVTYLYDNNLNAVTYNDDDGISFDSYIAYTNTTPNTTYYVKVGSYSGYGSTNSFYAINARCNVSGTIPTGGTTSTRGLTNTWTIMLYLNGEDPDFANILTQYRRGIESFIGSKRSFMTVTILYDPPDLTGTFRYLVQPNGAYVDGVNRWNVGELNMGDPNTLLNFVNWTMDQYPANHYYLAIDDHGNGAYGISFDASSLNDPLTPPELYSALKDATRNGNRKIDILDYEACLMGLAENAYDVRQWINYVVFFQQISWGINTYPAYFSDLLGTDTPITVGQRIVNRYYTGATAAGYPHTISFVDTSKMAAVNTAVNNFANALTATNNITAVFAARSNAQAFAADDDATNPSRAEYLDLWSLADKESGLVSTSIVNAMKAAVNSAVIAERHASGGVGGFIWSHNSAHGLSIYYPASKLSAAYIPYTAGSIYQMSRDGGWDEFLKWGVPGTQKAMFGARASFRLTGGSNIFIFKYVYLPLVRK